MSHRLLLLVLAIGGIARGAPPEVSAEPRRVVLGESTTVSVKVRTEPNAKLRFAASMGELHADNGSGNERRFTWTPPQTRIPAIALLLFWVEEGDAPPDVGTARILLIGRTDLEVTTEPGADVKVEVGGRVFGPRKADSTGQVSVPIEVPPAAFDARVLGEREGKQTEVTVPLGVPQYNPLVAIIGPTPLYSEGEGWLWVFDASDFYADKIVLAVRGGSAKETETTRHGTLFDVTPAPRSKRFSAVATAKGNTEARAEVSTQLVPGKPPEPPVKRPEPSVRFPTPKVFPAAFGGGYFAGGANLGLAAGISAAIHAYGPLSVEGTLGVRRASFSSPVGGLGELRSSLISIPVSLGVSARVLSAGPWTFSARAGAGVLPFIHTVSSDFQAASTESGLGWEAFGAAEVGHDIGPLEVFVELRGSYSPVASERLQARMGGFVLLVGARRSAL